MEHGLWFTLATIARDCLSDSVSTCVYLQAAMKQRSAQAIVLYAMDLERHHGAFPIEAARQPFLADELWQPTGATWNASLRQRTVFGRAGWPQLMSAGRLELTGDPFLALRFPALFRLPAGVTR